MTDVLLLPGVVLPASLAYGALLDALPEGTNAVAKDLELYAADEPAAGYTLGGRSNPAWFAAMADRLAAALSDFTLEVFEDRHHFDPPHRAEPERLARTLVAFWSRDGL